MMHKHYFSYLKLIKRLCYRLTPRGVGVGTVLCVSLVHGGGALAFDGQTQVTAEEHATYEFPLYVRDIVGRTDRPPYNGVRKVIKMQLRIKDSWAGARTTILSATPIRAPGLNGATTESCTVTSIGGNAYELTMTAYFDPNVGTAPDGGGWDDIQSLCKVDVRVTDVSRPPRVDAQGVSITRPEDGHKAGGWVHRNFSVCATQDCSETITGKWAMVADMTGWAGAQPIKHGNKDVLQAAASLDIQYNKQITLTSANPSQIAMATSGTGSARAMWSTDNDTGLVRLTSRDGGSWRPGSEITIKGGETYYAELMTPNALPWGTKRENWTFVWSIQ